MSAGKVNCTVDQVLPPSSDRLISVRAALVIGLGGSASNAPAAMNATPSLSMPIVGSAASRSMYAA